MNSRREIKAAKASSSRMKMEKICQAQAQRERITAGFMSTKKSEKTKHNIYLC